MFHMFRKKTQFIYWNIRSLYKPEIMDKHAILSLGLPVVVGNRAGKRATIELNANYCVVCRFHPNNSVYLGDADLEKWYPVNWFERIVYSINA